MPWESALKDGAHLRMWTLLARVRQLRVERGRRLLKAARLAVERAAADTGRQRDAIALHEARRREILAACSCGERGASLWRMALHRHDSDKSALESALAFACRAEERAQAQVVSALRVLQREMRGQDYARERVNRLVSAKHDDSDSDD